MLSGELKARASKLEREVKVSADWEGEPAAWAPRAVAAGACRVRFQSREHRARQPHAPRAGRRRRRNTADAAPQERSEAERRRREKERILAEREAARQRAREEDKRERRLALLAAEQAVSATPWGGVFGVPAARLAGWNSTHGHCQPAGRPGSQPLTPPPPTLPQDRERREAETEANRGVYFRAHLQAAPTSAAAATARGIKRAVDKLVLPAGVGAVLMAQEAFKNGVRARRGWTTGAAQLRSCGSNAHHLH
jgi:hypothetical protein